MGEEKIKLSFIREEFQFLSSKDYDQEGFLCIKADIPPDPPLKPIPPRGKTVTPREEILEDNLFAMFEWGEKVKRGNR